MIAEFRMNGKPTEPEIIQVTEYELSCRCKMVTATILSTTNYFRMPNDIFNLDLCGGDCGLCFYLAYGKPQDIYLLPVVQNYRQGSENE